MPKQLNLKARPDGGWSLSVVTDTTRALHSRYAAICGAIDKGTLMLAVRRAGGELTKQTLELDDGYLPYATADFSAGTSLGDVRIVFPFCSDFAGEDGDMSDRAVTVHTMGEVPDRVADHIVERLIEALPQPPRPAVDEGGDVDEMLPVHALVGADEGLDIDAM